jgi:Ni,Fe-hydrogenase maturation factor
MRRVIVYGCGRPDRRDDQVGLLAAEELAQAPPPDTEVRLSQAPGADLLTDLEGAGLLIVLDAAPAGPALPAGRVTRIDLAETADRSEPVPDSTGRSGPRPVPAAAAPPGVSAHTLDVNTALELGRRLGLLPPNVWLYVVGCSDFGYGRECSPPVALAIPRLVRQVREDIAQWEQRPEPAGELASKPRCTS